MMIQQTSIDSYKIVKETKKTAEQTIYDTILSRGTATNRQISILTKIPINSVTARVVELRDQGRVEQYGTEFDLTTRRNAMTWRVKCLI